MIHAKLVIFMISISLISSIFGEASLQLKRESDSLNQYIVELLHFLDQHNQTTQIYLISKTFHLDDSISSVYKLIDAGQSLSYIGIISRRNSEEKREKIQKFFFADNLKEMQKVIPFRNIMKESIDVKQNFNKYFTNFYTKVIPRKLSKITFSGVFNEADEEEGESPVTTQTPQNPIPVGQSLNKNEKVTNKVKQNEIKTLKVTTTTVTKKSSSNNKVIRNNPDFKIQDYNNLTQISKNQNQVNNNQRFSNFNQANNQNQKTSKLPFGQSTIIDTSRLVLNPVADVETIPSNANPVTYWWYNAEQQDPNNYTYNFSINSTLPQNATNDQILERINSLLLINQRTTDPKLLAKQNEILTRLAELYKQQTTETTQQTLNEEERKRLEELLSQQEDQRGLLTDQQKKYEELLERQREQQELLDRQYALYQKQLEEQTTIFNDLNEQRKQEITNTNTSNTEEQKKLYAQLIKDQQEQARLLEEERRKLIEEQRTQNQLLIDQRTRYETILSEQELKQQKFIEDQKKIQEQLLNEQRELLNKLNQQTEEERRIDEEERRRRESEEERRKRLEEEIRKQFEEEQRLRRETQIRLEEEQKRLEEERRKQLIEEETIRRRVIEEEIRRQREEDDERKRFQDEILKKQLDEQRRRILEERERLRRDEEERLRREEDERNKREEDQRSNKDKEEQDRLNRIRIEEERLRRLIAELERLKNQRNNPTGLTQEQIRILLQNERNRLDQLRREEEAQKAKVIRPTENLYNVQFGGNVLPSTIGNESLYTLIPNGSSSSQTSTINRFS